MKKALSLVLALIMCVGAISFTAVPASAEIMRGACGDNATWTFDSNSGVLTVSGVGDMWDQHFDSGSGYDLDNQVKKIIIGNNITKIGDYAFESCGNAISVTIPNSVSVIGGHAFGWCYELTNVTIPDSVTSLGEYAFGTCKSITEIVIPKNVISIGKGAFDYNVELKKATFECDIEYIPDNMFYGCSALKEVVLPDSLTGIGEHAFCNCHALTAIKIPDGVTTIGYNAFSDCDALSSLNVPDSVEYLGNYAFCSCDNLVNARIGNGVTSLGEALFANCKKLENFVIGDNITSVFDSWGTKPFAGCDALVNIYVRSADIAAGLTNANAYSGLINRARTISIENTITEIPNYIDMIYVYSEDIVYNGVNYVSYSDHAHRWVPHFYLDELGMIFSGHKCAECGALKGSEEVNTHHFSTSWSYDDTDHWHGCADCDMKIEIEGHLYNDNGKCMICDHITTAKGDVNADGVVNSLDAATILKHDASLITLDDVQLTIGDVNSDGTVNSLDAAMVLKFDAGLIAGF